MKSGSRSRLEADSDTKIDGEDKIFICFVHTRLYGVWDDDEKRNERCELKKRKSGDGDEERNQEESKQTKKMSCSKISHMYTTLSFIRSFEITSFLSCVYFWYFSALMFSPFFKIIINELFSHIKNLNLTLQVHTRISLSLVISFSNILKWSTHSYYHHVVTHARASAKSSISLPSFSLTSHPEKLCVYSPQCSRLSHPYLILPIKFSWKVLTPNRKINTFISAVSMRHGSVWCGGGWEKERKKKRF